MSKVECPPKIQKELDLLYKNWFNNDENLSGDEYLEKYATKKTLEYLEWKDKIIAQAEKEGIMI